MKQVKYVILFADVSSAHAETVASVAKSQALKAKKASVQGGASKAKRSIRTTVRFHRPKTLITARAPKYPRKSAPVRARLDKFTIIKSPLTTESAMKKIEENNTLVFLVDIRANKPQIRQAVKELYECTAAQINTLIRPDGVKKAYVRLSADQDALEIANK
eukprot:Ihof_evm6s519 gene=Ihof_evmTU6s519